MTHPSIYLKPEWVKTIRDAVPDAERNGKLHAGQLALIYEQGWFKFLVPAEYSGLQLALPDQVRLEESLAWANGSLGWVVTLCSGAGWFGGFLQPDIAYQIFNHPHLCLAGSGASTGTATITDGGYIINGEWKYASGVHHATHITANCIIMQGDEPVLNDDGTPLIRPFIFDKKDVKVFSAWKYVGMMGTGSDAYKVDGLFVEANHCFRIDPSAVNIDAPLYKYPFRSLAEATLAANLSGLAMHFVDLCGPVFTRRADDKNMSATQREVLNETLYTAIQSLDKAREAFYRAVDASWQEIIRRDSISKETLTEVSKTSRILARTAREQVDALYPYCGLWAANPDTEINQVWRDLHTAGQHSLLTFAEA
jgi:alkylation response protein AidB-like acyl-CoA dehydrogenase